MLRFELRPRHVERKTTVPRERFRKTSERLLGCHFGPGSEGTLAQRQRSSPYKDGGIGPFLRAQAFANGAPAERAVKGKMVRIERLKAAATLVAGKVLAKAIDFPFRLLARVVHVSDMHHATTQFERRLHRISEPAALVLA